MRHLVRELFFTKKNYTFTKSVEIHTFVVL